VEEDAPAVDVDLKLVTRLYAEHATHLDGEHDATEIVDLPRHAGRWGRCCGISHRR
jgi:hypothetical protein